MKIHYLATSNIPSKNANSLQIVKMCEALSLIGKNIGLIFPNLECFNKSIQNYYDLKNKINILKVGKINNKIFNICSSNPIKIKNLFVYKIKK